VTAIELRPDDSFGNASRVQQALGWAIIKGFAVYNLADQAEGELSTPTIRPAHLPPPSPGVS